jgi:hypothetical protein
MAPLLIGWSQDTLSAVADFTTAFGSRGLSGGPAPEQIQNYNPLCDRLEDECSDVHSVVDPGCLSRIRIFPSRTRIRMFSIRRKSVGINLAN